MELWNCNTKLVTAVPRVAVLDWPFRILLTTNMFYLILTAITFYLFLTTTTFYSLLTTKTFYYSKTTAATYVRTHSQKSKPVSQPATRIAVRTQNTLSHA